MGIIRIATWNLDHASNSSRPVAKQIEKILNINPDILIMTETCDEVDLSEHGYSSVTCQQNEYGKYCSVIWSKHPIESIIPTYDVETAVCALVKINSKPILVYGSIITYAGDKGIDGKSKYWEEHYKEIGRQGDDWSRILQANPRIPFCVAGDFNQTRDGGQGTYGTPKGRALLTEQLERNSLICLTEEDYGATGRLTPDPKKGWARSNIDHICLSRGIFEVVDTGAWDHFTDDGVYLSDHNGVYVDINNPRMEQ